jgi:phospholipid/cholesterol/gamma-HCH transport system permease protein
MTPATVQLQTRASGERVITLAGDWTLASLGSSVARVWNALKSVAADPNLIWDLRRVEALDSTGALLIWRAWGGRRRADALLRPEHEPILKRLAAVPPVTWPRWRPDWLGPIVFLGRLEANFAGHVLGFIALIGLLVLDALYLLTHPLRIPWREVSATMYKAGALALPVTALVGFLIGVVLSYLIADTLKAYGAELYIIDLLGMSIIRELGPLLVAILLAGRSGAAMTAQIGVMRVTEEIDAMATMGISPTLRLVLPKVIGLALAMPLVSLWSTAAALAGGAAAANVQLDINYLYFFQALPKAVPAANIWIASVKALSFGAVIALIACHYGLRVKPNTESVSSSITNAVVAAITMVILLDAVYAIMFRSVGFP